MKIYELSAYQSAFDVYPTHYKRYKYRAAAMRNFHLYSNSAEYEKVDLFVFDTEKQKLYPVAIYTKPQEVAQ